MSTRSNIAFANPDGTITSVYCHWDGYPTNNGRILLRAYKTASKVKRLVGLGALSSLHERLYTRKPHSYDKPQKGVVIAYMRDRGEDSYCAPTSYADEEAWRLGDLEEWAYLFKDGKWYVIDCHCKREDRKIVPLTKDYIAEWRREENRDALVYWNERYHGEIPAQEVDGLRLGKEERKDLVKRGFLVKNENGTYSVGAAFCQ